MDYRRANACLYLRVDPGEELLATMLAVCAKEKIHTATFAGIGAMSRATIDTYIQDKQAFVSREQVGMLEMVSLNGNVTEVDGAPFIHAHGVFSTLDDPDTHEILAGHLKEATVGYTAEIRMVISPIHIDRQVDPSTGVAVWNFQDQDRYVQG